MGGFGSDIGGPPPRYYEGKAAPSLARMPRTDGVAKTRRAYEKKSGTQCNAEYKAGEYHYRCVMPHGHSGTHMAVDGVGF